MSALNAFKQLLCFLYGTSLTTAERHHPQSRMVVYTIGGLIFFVSIPFIFCGTTYLLLDQFNDVNPPWLHYGSLIVTASMITLAVIWTERALLVLADAIWPHWSAQMAMMALRLGMVLLFSAVIAQKYTMNEYKGPVSSQLAAMRENAYSHEKATANEAFELKQLGDNAETTKSKINQLKTELATPPDEIRNLLSQATTCKANASGLWAELQGLKELQNRSIPQQDRLTELQISARKHSAECRQRQAAYDTALREYNSPRQVELEQLVSQAGQFKTKLKEAENAADKQVKERFSEAEAALKMSGSDIRAFELVREQNPAIDREVRNTTLLLACLELLPILLKILTHNSPISSETRALLQHESAVFRNILRESIQREKVAKPIGSFAPPLYAIRPYFQPPTNQPSSGEPSASYPNTPPS
ncbi:MAG: DUF4407 domain-containing protein [Gallionella sp.]|nr:DUF4407 domain-containing protein [Gallionella sp.]